ncbi:tetratricopeptide repeat protein [Corallococcus sp. EGB]|uniref:tetratricopeptide repeat protein n=1 Tax=Corallococcus sp. EGB TaxID=1521117 RepID=UPI001CBBE248|nr:tetratricopeptide repeat protein [Corallococcus sp. EGB]
MRPSESWSTWLAVAVMVCGGATAAWGEAPRYVTTTGALAIENLDHRIALQRADAGVGELLLLRARFLSDYDALDRASTLAEERSRTAGDLLERARARSAVHRFAEALTDLDAAGKDDEASSDLRASILVATGHASEAISRLEARVAQRPGYASRSALAGAYAAVGRFTDADRLYSEALADLDTTSPFPYAWIYFARGVMWAEQAGDPARAEPLYARALAHLPEFAMANVHLAELEAARGDVASAMTRLERVVASTHEPEALALLGTLHLRTGAPVRGRSEITAARERFEALLVRQPLAFADHAARFYLGPGADPERAWVLAQQSLEGRQTASAFTLAIEAARATGRECEACVLVEASRARGLPVPGDGCP